MPTLLGAQSVFSSVREYSDATAAQLDQEVKSILTQGEEHVTQMRTEHNPVLIKVAEELLQKEVLMEEDFRALMKASGNQA